MSTKYVHWPCVCVRRWAHSSESYGTRKSYIPSLIYVHTHIIIHTSISLFSCTGCIVFLVNQRAIWYWETSWKEFQIFNRSIMFVLCLDTRVFVSGRFFVMAILKKHIRDSCGSSLSRKYTSSSALRFFSPFSIFPRVPTYHLHYS